MDIREATSLYEQWLSEHISLIQADIAHKHQQMGLAAFPFLKQHITGGPRRGWMFARS